MLARRPKRCPLPSITTYIKRNTGLARDALGISMLDHPETIVHGDVESGLAKKKKTGE
jgi:hypothetical protein